MWQSFIRNPGTKEPLTDIGNETLICSHGGLLFPVEPETETDHASVVFMVTEDEWAELQRHFNVDHVIRVSRKVPPPESGSPFSSSPEICVACIAQRHEQEQQERLRYVNEPVFVRRLQEADVNNGHDPDYANANSEAPHAKKLKLESDSFVRRSNRRQKIRGEREFIVSSDTSLKDLKVKIMDAFNVATYDQNLLLNGVAPLADATKTLAELGVEPHALICLRADEIVGPGDQERDEVGREERLGDGCNGQNGASKANGDSVSAVGRLIPEQGFKGTYIGHRALSKETKYAILHFRHGARRRHLRPIISCYFYKRNKLYIDNYAIR